MSSFSCLLWQKRWVFGAGPRDLCVWLDGKRVLRVQRRAGTASCLATLKAWNRITPRMYQASKTSPACFPRTWPQTWDSAWPVIPRETQRHICQFSSAQPQGSAYNPLLPYLPLSFLLLFFPFLASFPFFQSSVGRQRAVALGVSAIRSGATLPLPTFHPFLTPTAWYF